MNSYVVYCHPDPESFTAALRDRVVDALRSAGHEVRVSDLHADGFDPTLSQREWRDHLAVPEMLPPDIAAYCDNLRWCDALVFVYPTWWSGQPAMLTGWLDRVLVRGVAWDVHEGSTRIRARLTNVRRLVAVTSHGSGKLLNIVEGETGRRIIGRAVRVLCHRCARTSWLALYNIDRSTDAQRRAFLDRVGQRMTDL
ncbi:MAG: NAD(P)H-dependent oxidoreductase [Ilumatobacteraceae bacterium]